MKLAIVGTRNPSVSYEEFKALCAPHMSGVTHIVSGGAKGIDSLAATFANESNLPLIVHLPDYKSYGKAAPLVRNTQIVADADRVLAFVSAESKGTWDSIRKAKKENKQVVIINI